MARREEQQREFNAVVNENYLEQKAEFVAADSFPEAEEERGRPMLPRNGKLKILIVREGNADPIKEISLTGAINRNGYYEERVELVQEEEDEEWEREENENGEELEGKRRSRGES